MPGRSGRFRSGSSRFAARKPVPLYRRVRFHDLRHTAASLYLGAGVDPVIVQKTLGHAEVTMTVERYGHFAPDHEQRELEKLRLRPGHVDRHVDSGPGPSKAPIASPKS